MDLGKKILALGLVLTVVAIVAPGMASADEVSDLQAQIEALLAELANLQARLTELEGGAPAGEVPEACEGVTFDRNLYYGITGDDVKCLQALLNTDEETKVATTGAGSPGNETSYFGSLTKAAVIKFQEKYREDVLEPWGLTLGTGYVGSTTRAKLNELLTAVPPAPEPEDFDNEADCEAAGFYWYDDACHEEEEVIVCADYETEEECPATCYWYEDACHEEAPTCSDYETEEECPASCYWYAGACHEEEATCEDYETEDECEEAGCYWYDSACHEEAPPPEEGVLRVDTAAMPADGTEVSVGEEDEEVLGIELEAQGSDIEVQRIDLWFEVNNPMDRPWSFLKEISLFHGDEEIARKEISSGDFIKDAPVFYLVNDDAYVIRFSGLDVDVDDGEKEVVTVKVSALTTIDSAYLPLNMSVWVPFNGVRGRDTAGYNQWAGGAGAQREFTIPVVATGEIETKLSIDSPEEGVAMVSDTAATEDVEIMKFDLKAEVTDVTVEEIALEIFGQDDTGAAKDVDEIANVAKLYNEDGDLIGTDAINDLGGVGAAIVTFDDLNLPIDKDETETLTVKVNVREIDANDNGACDAGEACEGDMVRAELDVVTPAFPANGHLIDAEDVYGLPVVTFTGSAATGRDIHLYTVAPSLSLVSATITKTAGDPTVPTSDVADVTMEIEVTAHGGDVFVMADNGAVAGGIDVSEDPNFGGGAATTFHYDSSAPVQPANGSFLVTSGSTETFTISAHLDPTSAIGDGVDNTEYYRLVVDAFEWDTADSAPGAGTTWLWGLEDFVTDSVYLEDCNPT